MQCIPESPGLEGCNALQATNWHKPLSNSKLQASAPNKSLPVDLWPGGALMRRAGRGRARPSARRRVYMRLRRWRGSRRTRRRRYEDDGTERERTRRHGGSVWLAARALFKNAKTFNTPNLDPDSEEGALSRAAWELHTERSISSNPAGPQRPGRRAHTGASQALRR
eukprot:2977388-Prymnesium_polylepis.1